AELAAGERAAVAHDCERELLGAQARAARERPVEPFGAVELAAAARLDDPVGEEDDALALAEPRARLLVALAGLNAEREAGCGAGGESGSAAAGGGRLAGEQRRCRRGGVRVGGGAGGVGWACWSRARRSRCWYHREGPFQGGARPTRPRGAKTSYTRVARNMWG